MSQLQFVCAVVSIPLVALTILNIAQIDLVFPLDTSKLTIFTVSQYFLNFLFVMKQLI